MCFRADVAREHNLADTPTEVVVNIHHNHTVGKVFDLKYRDVAPETDEKLRTLLKAGHTPGQARRIYGRQLKAQGFRLWNWADKKIYPDYQYVRRLDFIIIVNNFFT